MTRRSMSRLSMPATAEVGADGEAVSATSASRRATALVMAVPCSAVAMVMSAVAALNTALPFMAVDTGATQSQLTWIVDSYTLTLACMLLLAGALGDRWGRRGLMIVGLVVFAVGSLMPLLLDSPTWIIVARAVTGIGAAAAMPATLSIITGSLPNDKRTQGVAVWTAFAGSGAVFGMIGSGLALEVSSWRLIFLVFAVASALLAVASIVLPNSKDSTDAPLDWAGGVVGAAGIAAFVIGLLETPHRGWTSPLVIGCVVGGLALIAVFCVVELRTRRPLLDIRLFANRSFGSGSVSLTAQFLGMFGLFFLTVQYLQLIFGYSPLVSALGLAPVGIFVVVLAVVSPKLSAWIGYNVVTILGLVAMGVGLLAVNFLEAGTPYLHAAVILGTAGAGLGLAMAPGTTAVVNSVPRDKQGVASAVNDLTRELGAAIGLAIAGSVLAAGYTNGIEPAASAVPPQARDAVEGSLASALEVAKIAGPRGTDLADAAREAFLSGMHHAGTVLGVILLVLAVVAAVWAPRWLPAPIDAADVPETSRSM